MSRLFDTGLAVASRTVARNRIAELLGPLLKGGSYMNGDVENVGFLKAIVKLDAPLESYGDGEDLNRLYSSLLGRAPAILIALGDRDLKPAGGTGGTRRTGQLEVHVYFLNNHSRSLLARVEADVVAAGDPDHVPPIAGIDTADPGIDVAMQMAEELLAGQRLDTETEGAVIKHLELVRERALYTSNKHTLWSQTYLVGVTSTINTKRGITQRMTGIDTTIRPSGELAASPASTTFTTELEE